MSESAAAGAHLPGRYEIRVVGHLEPRWAAWFDGMVLTAEEDGTTLVHGLLLDQAALHGLLTKLHDVGLPLVSVARIAGPPHPRPNHTR